VEFVSPSAAVSNGKAAVDQAANQVKPGEVKNQYFTDLLAQKKEALKKQKEKVWAEAWKGQATMMFWPTFEHSDPTKARLENDYFGDPITDLERSDFREPGTYDGQIPPKVLADWLYPIAANWDTLVKRATFTKDPTAEEMWLAQEDLWVQYEMLRIIREA